MKQILAFFKLIRTLNLLFIAITQYLFQYFIVIPLFNDYGLALPLSGRYFWLLLCSSVLIAAAGYIINDYFDLNIDRVNKPEKLVVEKYIRRRWAIIWHLVLSFLGVLLTAIAVGMAYWYLVLANTCQHNPFCLAAQLCKIRRPGSFFQFRQDQEQRHNHKRNGIHD